MSHGSKIGISLLIGLRRPLVEGRERIVERPPIALRQDDPATLDIIDKLVSRFQTECRPHRSRDRRLRLAGQLACNHRLARCYPANKCKEFPYHRQLPAAPLALSVKSRRSILLPGMLDCAGRGKDAEMADRVERRLTTILAADVAEYSRLMRADEDNTLAALTACRAIVDELIAGSRGRIANTAGDSVLAEFPSVTEALSCALA